MSEDAINGITGSYTPTGNVMLYAIWDANSFPVSYDANGGTNAPESQTKYFNIALTLSTTEPTRANSNGVATVTFNPNGGTVSPESMTVNYWCSYSFKSWNTAADGSGLSYFPGSNYTGNAKLKLFAQWRINIYPGHITLPTPTRDGYTFKGWNTRINAVNGFTGNYSISDDMTFYAIWKANTYTVTYDANGGEDKPENQAKTHDKALTLSTSVPTRASNEEQFTVKLSANGGIVNTTSLSASHTTSYTFKNWNTKADGSGTSYNPSASYTANSDVTLYAQWDSSTTTAAVTLPTPTRTGYTFKGWTTSSTATTGITGSYTPTGNVTLYAVWQQITPDLTLPALLTTIESEAFAGGGFTSVLIPPTVKTIAPDAFGDRTDLIILGTSGSYAETFAGEKHFTFVPAA